MSDYKVTLNLPQTDFPMKANLAHKEPARLQAWNDANLYEQIQTFSAGKPSFVLHDGPPYANGTLHLGHALNKILKDIILKSKVFSGFSAPYVPGWDCHGLPIELNVEKKFGKASKDLEGFIQACRTYAGKQMDIQREAFKRLGVLGDWNTPYCTMDFQYEADMVRAFGRLFDKGFIQKGFKPVHWCLDCQSALAAAEVEYQDKTSPSIDVAFVLKETQAAWSLFSKETMPEDCQLTLPIWTTTPWTLPANAAVCVHPDLRYTLSHAEGRYLILAEALQAETWKRLGVTEAEVLGCIDGAKLSGLFCQHPFESRTVPVILGTHVTTDAGTGAVHTAPAHGQEDYEACLKAGVEMIHTLGDNGCFLNDIEGLAGVFLRKANPIILERLAHSNTLLAHTELSHSYPHCWRHKSPLIFRATPQWFLNLEHNNLREKTLHAIESTVQWIPEHGEARIEAMIENHPGWCLSRQRTWGVPIPLFLHRDTAELHPKTSAFFEMIAQAFEKEGVLAWHQSTLAETLGVDLSEYRASPDILDVWFDSGLTHACVLQERESLSAPADLYLEGSDQHRGWFQSSLLTSMALEESPPYKAVLTHGFTVDAEGRKMSKSIGNVIAPETVIQQYGADILRLWVASTDSRGEVTVSFDVFKQISDAYRRLRNTARFLLANLHDFNPETDRVVWEEQLLLDQWIQDRAASVQKEIIAAYDAYQFNRVYQALYHFCTIDLGGFYLDVIKDRQYTLKAESLARRSAQTAIHDVLQALVRCLAPILSFTAEEIWEHMPHAKGSVFLNHWAMLSHFSDTEKAEKEALFEAIFVLRDAVYKSIETARQEDLLKGGLDAKVTARVGEGLFTQLKPLTEALHRFCIVSQLTLQADDSLSSMECVADIAVLEVSKCVRCWHRDGSVGASSKHPELCARCESNVDGDGETRFGA